MSERVVELPSSRTAPPPEFERRPPQDLPAEQSVLGGMLLSKDAIADVVEVLKSADFYKPAHATVFDVVLDLYGRGDPADAVTVSAELTRRGEIARVGGAPYLHTLLSSVPTAANAGYYARIVAERAVLRRLVEAGTRIVQLAYSSEGDVDEIVDRSQQTLYEVTERRTSEDYVLLEHLMQPTMDELEAIGGRAGGLAGVPTGFAELDRLTNGLHPGQLIVIAGRPGLGKSTMGLDVARSASVKHGRTSAIFSLEMAKTEITMRLLSAEARVPLHHMRSGTMTDQDWTRLATRMGEVSEAPLFIDDSPNLTMMEIRAKARRLRQRHDLQLLVIDYLQLMTGNRRAESRQQEVSELSRSLKLLAKELEIPVIAMSQLNRGAEQRTDKRPQLSDLRESGCLPASTRVLRADTGAEVTLGELFTCGARDVPVWSLDESLRYVRRHLTHVFGTGVRPVLRLTLASGKQVRATANHPFLTHDGWRPLDQLALGVSIAVPRHVPAPTTELAWDDDRVVQLADLLGGGCVRRQRADNPLGPAWLADLGLSELSPHQAFVPAAVAMLPKRQIRLFVRHLWAARGAITVNPARGTGLISWASPSRRLCQDTSRLLLRFGISTRLSTGLQPGRAGDGWVLEVPGAQDQRRFLDEIGVPVTFGNQVQTLRSALQQRPATAAGDTVAADLWQRVGSVLREPAGAPRARPATVGRPPASSVALDGSAGAQRLGRVAAILDERQLEIVATNDVLWDPVVSIEPDGVEEVFDATVVGTHNFIADGVAVHNSIEQDADVVILLHREDAYEKESPRAGEADFIVAKHRNGPTATITVAFQGHYSRFVDMSPA